MTPKTHTSAEHIAQIMKNNKFFLGSTGYEPCCNEKSINCLWDL